MSVMVYGPQGCGKTRNSEKLRAALECTSVVDGCTKAGRASFMDDHGRLHVAVAKGVLLLAAMPQREALRISARHQIDLCISFEEAMRIADGAK